NEGDSGPTLAPTFLLSNRGIGPLEGDEVRLAVQFEFDLKTKNGPLRLGREAGSEGAVWRRRRERSPERRPRSAVGYLPPTMSSATYAATLLISSGVSWPLN